jgi:hypothetical protein
MKEDFQFVNRFGDEPTDHFSRTLIPPIRQNKRNIAIALKDVKVFNKIGLLSTPVSVEGGIAFRVGRQHVNTVTGENMYVWVASLMLHVPKGTTFSSLEQTCEWINNQSARLMFRSTEEYYYYMVKAHPQIADMPLTSWEAYHQGNDWDSVGVSMAVMMTNAEIVKVKDFVHCKVEPSTGHAHYALVAESVQHLECDIGCIRVHPLLWKHFGQKFKLPDGVGSLNQNNYQPEEQKIIQEFYWKHQGIDQLDYSFSWFDRAYRCVKNPADIRPKHLHPSSDDGLERPLDPTLFLDFIKVVSDCTVDEPVGTGLLDVIPYKAIYQSSRDMAVVWDNKYKLLKRVPSSYLDRITIFFQDKDGDPLIIPANAWVITTVQVHW